jgi:hypothetical protein
MVLEIRRVCSGSREFLCLGLCPGPRSEFHFGQVFPIILMILGTIIAASVGRVVYQIALSVTGEDNGFVSVFFLGCVDEFDQA